MGGHLYLYFTPFERDIEIALQNLREREFKAGRYDPAMQAATPPSYMFQLDFPLDDSIPSPGAQHGSIDEAMEASSESGTGSILDLMRITAAPDFLAASPVSPDDLLTLFGTCEPTREVVEGVLNNGHRHVGSDQLNRFWEQIDRGQGRYIVIYANGAPSEIFFVGCSLD